MWQDTVLMIAGLAFAPALIMSIKDKAKIPLKTSIPTAIAMTAVVVCVITLGLYKAAVMDGITTTCWYILVFRR